MVIASASPVFDGWEPRHASLWTTQPLCLSHRLAGSPLFTRASLADLIERYPVEKYTLVHMGAQGERKLWRQGVIGDATGAQVFEAIAAGRLWINLLHVNEVDSRYNELLNQIFAEVSEHVPGYATFSRINGILISSPGAQVYYHFDLFGQSLWQIEGSKRVYLYPPVPPFLKQENLERVAMYRDEVSIEYETWFDEYAYVHELQPGQMMHWPLNSPHRIENQDRLSVSMTAEYFTHDIRRKLMLNTANGILRERLGVSPGRDVSGAGFWSKALLQSAVWRSGLLEGERRKRLAITFKLDPARPGQIIDI
jgi:hypothetical protein